MDVLATAQPGIGFGRASDFNKAFNTRATTYASYEERIRSVKVAQQQFAGFNQEQIDRIFAFAARAAALRSRTLAEHAVAETGMGVVADKEHKNLFASDVIYTRYKNEKTADIIFEDKINGITKFAEPIGVIAAIVPVTNPTSTTIFKALLALKTRNGIVFFPHPRAKRCTVRAARIVLEAAVNAGAPEGIIDWIDEPGVELTNSLIRHDDVSLILATGGPAMVKAAYYSGKPAIGVGSGNTPAIIDKSADAGEAVDSIITSKLFDNGLICASEQAVIVDGALYANVKCLFEEKGAHVLSHDECERLRLLISSDGRLNPAIIGQPASKIAAMARVDVPSGTKVLVAEVQEIGPSEPLSREKLSPVLAMYRVDNFEHALDKACQIVNYGGRGHTASLHIDPGEQRKIGYFLERLKTGRLLLNSPSSQGAIGGIYNYLDPSLTLGCGSWGGNAICENVGVAQLLNVKTLAEQRGHIGRREDAPAFIERVSGQSRLGH